MFPEAPEVRTKVANPSDHMFTIGTLLTLEIITGLVHVPGLPHPGWPNPELALHSAKATQSTQEFLHPNRIIP
jgi:hypothetical protein